MGKIGIIWKSAPKKKEGSGKRTRKGKKVSRGEKGKEKKGTKNSLIIWIQDTLTTASSANYGGGFQCPGRGSTALFTDKLKDTLENGYKRDIYTIML